jgi:hypothetical protein
VLRRFFIVLLMLSHLAYGAVVVADGHWLDGGDPAHELTATQGADEHGGDLGCDHCCHAASHLTGLPSSPLSLAPASATVLTLATSSDFESLPPIPALRPPRA